MTRGCVGRLWQLGSLSLELASKKRKRKRSNFKTAKRTIRWKRRRGTETRFRGRGKITRHANRLGEDCRLAGTWQAHALGSWPVTITVQFTVASREYKRKGQLAGAKACHFSTRPDLARTCAVAVPGKANWVTAGLEMAAVVIKAPCNRDARLI